MAEMSAAARLAYLRSKLAEINRLALESDAEREVSPAVRARMERASEAVYDHLLVLEESGALAEAQRMLAAAELGALPRRARP